MKRPVHNLAASVHQRLLNRYHQQGGDFHGLLLRYGLERLLYRLGQSEHCDRFIVKGATLFALWSPDAHRATKDLDLLGKGDHSVDSLVALFQDVCRSQVDEDGLVFEAQSVKGSVIRRDEEYEGVRVVMVARLDQSRIPLQVDIGFGDVVTPSPELVEFSSILDFPKPVLKAYPKETVIAEKFQAMVDLGMANTRMKDFYDVWALSQKYDFEGGVVSLAIRHTFTRRKTALPETLPLALSDEFSKSPEKISVWKAFLAKTGQGEIELKFILSALRDFLMPPVRALVTEQDFSRKWTAADKWNRTSTP